MPRNTIPLQEVGSDWFGLATVNLSTRSKLPTLETVGPIYFTKQPVGGGRYRPESEHAGAATNPIQLFFSPKLLENISEKFVFHLDEDCLSTFLDLWSRVESNILSF